jgi:hypothetical protein
MIRDMTRKRGTRNGRKMGGSLTLSFTFLWGVCFHFFCTYLSFVFLFFLMWRLQVRTHSIPPLPTILMAARTRGYMGDHQQSGDILVLFFSSLFIFCSQLTAEGGHKNYFKTTKRLRGDSIHVWRQTVRRRTFGARSLARASWRRELFFFFHYYLTFHSVILICNNKTELARYSKTTMR